MSRFAMLSIAALYILLSSCTNSRKQLAARDIAVSLIERDYPVDGRRVEYSQMDSTDAELKGYFIGRIYIDSSDSIRIEKFHLNYIKTKADIVDSFTISSGIYKDLLIGNKVFTGTMLEDFKRIYGKLCEPNMHTPEQDSINRAINAQVDSIIASNLMY